MATDRRTPRVLAIGLVAALLPYAAPAQQSGTDTPEMLPVAIGRAHDVALSRIGQELSPQQLGVLHLIAHATTAASLCPNLTLNESEIYGALAAVTHEVADGMTFAEQVLHRDFVMIAYGTMSALHLVEATEDEARFCALAIEDATDPDEVAFLQVAAAPDAATTEPAPTAAPPAQAD